ncbi:MAG: deoxynucleoside kinase [bacterium]
MNRHYYFAVEGVIGVGKTSFAKLLHKRLGGRLILEESEKNPYLEDFYKDPESFNFQVQIYFLLNRYRQLVNIPQRDLFHDYLIVDYIFQKDRIFANLNLDDRDLRLYTRVARLLEKELTAPDLVIYLQSDTNSLMSNIKKRRKSFEKNISRDYIKKLNEAYNQFFFAYSESPLLIINTQEIDFVNNKEDLDDLVHLIMNPPSGIKFYVPRKR